MADLYVCTFSNNPNLINRPIVFDSLSTAMKSWKKSYSDAEVDVVINEVKPTTLWTVDIIDGNGVKIQVGLIRRQHVYDTWEYLFPNINFTKWW